MLSNKGNDAKLCMCPYNPAHMLLPHRLQTHVVKCRQQHTNVQHDVCPNNTTHIIPAPEMAFHLEVCEDRQNIDKFVYTSSSGDEKFPIPVLNLQSDENWDDDEYYHTYNPEEHCINNPILRNKNVLPQAQRKHFRMEERVRVQQFQNQTKKEIPVEKETTVSRLPYGVSLGVANAKKLEEDDVSHLMSEIDLGSNKVQYPKMSATVEDESIEYRNENIESDLYYPRSGVAPMAVKKNFGRGRGLGQKQ